MIASIGLLLALTADSGPVDRVRLEAAVVVASLNAPAQSAEPALLRPLRQRLGKLLPYRSYKGVTEYTASLAPGDALEVRLPDGRRGLLRPAPRGPDASRSVHVSIDRGEEFDSKGRCGQVAVFQVGQGPATAGDRTFLVYSEICPGEGHGASMSPRP